MLLLLTPKNNVWYISKKIDIERFKLLLFWDCFLFWAHLTVIIFNLLGWIVPQWRKAHLIVAGITLISWFVMGIWYGFGYCFVTDWHWEVKQELGETNLPSSFIKYFIDRFLHWSISEIMADILTVTCFFSAILISVYLNYFKKS